jgi:diacylglycerol kinase family enzyme
VIAARIIGGEALHARNVAAAPVFGLLMLPAPKAAALERLADTATLERPVRTRRMLVIVNPYATSMSPRLRQLVLDALQGRFAVEAVDTQRKGHAIELCHEAAADDYDVVAAFGGDGTINEVANGLAGSNTALTCLPGGATNVYCRMLGIPTEVVDATEHLLGLADAWRPRAVDVARVNDRWFTFSAGAGLDASVVERVDSHPHLKSRFGPWYYAEAALTTFLRNYVVNPPRVVASVAGRSAEGVSVFVQNARPYTFFRTTPVDIAPRAGLATGDISGAVLTRANALDVPTMAYRLLSRRARVAGHRRVAVFDGIGGLRVRSVDDRPVPVQVDGDYIGPQEEARFSVLPGGLKVVA